MITAADNYTLIDEIPLLLNEARLLRLTHQELDSMTEEELLSAIELADLPMCQGLNLAGKDRDTLIRLAHLARRTVANLGWVRFRTRFS